MNFEFSLMANPILSAPSLLKENIFFLTVGTFISSICILLFDGRLYTGGEVFLLFIALFLLLLLQAFFESANYLTSANGVLLLYLRSLFISITFLTILYAFLLPFKFDIFLTFKFSLLLTFIETSLHFFIRFKKEFQLNQEKEKMISQTIKQQQVRELEVLKQQIDPHFIFNSFNTLAFLIDENSEKAKLFSNKLANVHRYIIFNSNKNLVSIADEVGFAKDYAFLQEIRHSLSPLQIAPSYSVHRSLPFTRSPPVHIHYSLLHQNRRLSCAFSSKNLQNKIFAMVDINLSSSCCLLVPIT